MTLVTDPSATEIRMASYRGRHFLDDQDHTAEEFLEVVGFAGRLKALWKLKPCVPFLLGRRLSMIFDQGSCLTLVVARGSQPTTVVLASETKSQAQRWYLRSGRRRMQEPSPSPGDRPIRTRRRMGFRDTVML